MLTYVKGYNQVDLFVEKIETRGPAFYVKALLATFVLCIGNLAHDKRPCWMKGDTRVCDLTR